MHELEVRLRPHYLRRVIAYADRYETGEGRSRVDVEVDRLPVDAHNLVAGWHCWPAVAEID
jgi:hypothetical protein